MPNHSCYSTMTIRSQQSYKKRLKMKFQEKSPTKKQDLPKEVKFIDNEDPTLAENKL